MASIKKPTYKVETKLAPERKRRKSDLVLMWQSMMDVTGIVIKELWTTIIKLWEFIQIWFSSSDRFLVQTWLEKYLPYVPEDFAESWRDGRLLAILLNKLQPGCFPDAYHLDPDYGLRNVYRIFDALEIYFGIKPNVSVEEIVTCSDGSDTKLFAILLELKNQTDGQPINKDQKPEYSENIESSIVDKSCIVKGTGLGIGFVGRTANFIIFCTTMSDLDIVVEIRGPNTICSERITKRSPRKKNLRLSWQNSKHLTRSTSLNEYEDSLNPEELGSFEKGIIPMEYEIVGNQISLGYKPREKGKHRLTILWHGQHVSDSPYLVTVEDPLEVITTKSETPLKSAFRGSNVVEKQASRKISFQVQESQLKPVKHENKSKYKSKTTGKVISRKLIRYIVKINGKDIPVNAENTQSLATELLKMDYDFETCPSFHRRNSWGFAGDAERKKSVIRQFCIDAKELDAQISQRRTRSLSVNPGSKKLLERSDSFDSLCSKLNCLNEDVFENSGKAYENEDDYAYITEDINAPDETSEIKLDTSSVTARENNSENNTLLSELTGSKFDKSLKASSNDATEDDKTSSLSINKIQEEKIDSPEDDLHINVLPYSSSLKSEPIIVDKEDKLSASYQCTDKNLLNNNSSGHDDNLKNVNIPYSSKIIRNNPKVNICRKKMHKCLSKNAIIENKIRNITVKTFYRKISKNTNLIAAYRKRGVNIRSGLKLKEGKVTKMFKNIQLSNVNESIQPNFKYKNAALEQISKDFSSENYNKTPKFTSKIKECKSKTNAVKYPGNTELKTNSGIFPFCRYIPQHQLEKDKHQFPQNIAEEPEVKSVAVKRKLYSVFNASIYSGVKTRDKNAILNQQPHSNLESTRQITLNCNNYIDNLSNATQPDDKTKSITSNTSKPLRIHTLKALGQFNFAQFNPPVYSDNTTSPVKSQIEHWENALSSEKECASTKKLHEAYDTEQVNVKKKLAFWECRTKEYSENSSPENNRKTNLTVNKKPSLCVSDPLRNDDLQKPHSSSGISSNIPVETAKEENVIFINENSNLIIKNQAEAKIFSDFQINADKIRSLSFSDPLVNEIALDKTENTPSFRSSESSKKEYPSSSCDDSLEEYDSDDSGGDYILHSTEDEYIDDEISERASEYWGDLSIVKNWKMPISPSNEHPSLDEEFLQNYNQRDNSYPEECIIFGIAVYYGYVAVKNRFQVFTGEAGFGNLSVSMQGLRRHEVSLVSVTYLRNDIYEVTYQVMNVGYYLISIRWMDRDVPGSPFVCKVTF